MLPVLLIDDQISRLEGAALFVIAIVYTAWMVRAALATVTMRSVQRDAKAASEAADAAGGPAVSGISLISAVHPSLPLDFCSSHRATETLLGAAQVRFQRVACGMLRAECQTRQVQRITDAHAAQLALDVGAVTLAADTFIFTVTSVMWTLSSLARSTYSCGVARAFIASSASLVVRRLCDEASIKLLDEEEIAL